jgi:hypothetical protein
MPESDLTKRFPDMRPIGSAPSLASFAGCGLALHGARDHDSETGTFITTRWLCVLFVPVFALTAYRASRTASGLQLLGRVPLSPLVMAWDGLVGLALIVLGGYWTWYHHTHSPAFLSAHKVVDADQLAEAGQVVAAAELYREVALSDSPNVPTARARLLFLVEQLPGSASLEDTVQVVRCAVEVEQHHHSKGSPLLAWGSRLAASQGQTDPHAVLPILDLIAPLAADGFIVPRQQVLQNIVAREPDNLDALGRLASCYQARGQWSRCEELLTPHRARLGITEGARALGQVYARQGKLDAALALLQPYVAGRVQRLHAAQKALAEATQQPAGADPAEAAARLRADPAVRSAQAAVNRDLVVIPVAFELAMLRIQRAQALTDVTARRAELERAEETLLGIHSVLGENDAYRLKLAQVYYGLGKHAEGRKQLDQMLAARNRDVATLLQVSTLLREVGAVADARALAEEAFGRETDPTRKSAAAVRRAVIALDLEDNISWLRKANAADLEVKALLSAALGSQAFQDGNDDQAAQHLREAIELYGQQGASGSSLNNRAIAYEGLYQVTGDPTHLGTAAAMLAKALAQQPQDSILLSNLARVTLEAALRDIIGAAIDLGALKQRAGWRHLAYLYQDQAERDEVIARVRKHPGVARARSYYERLLLLAPRSSTGYHALLNLHLFTRDVDALRALAKQLKGVELDLTDSNRDQLDAFAGKDDARLRKEKTVTLHRQQQLLKQTRKNGADLTLAVALAMLNSTQAELEALGQPIKGDDLVARAEEALRLAPSAATQEGLRAALLTRACQSLARDQPAFRQLQERVRRSLDPSYLVAVVLSQPGELGDVVRKDADVQRAIRLSPDLGTRFPDEPEELTWAMLRGTDAAGADAVAKALQAEPIPPVQRAIEAQLNPLSAAVAYKEYWALQLAGRDELALAVLRRCAARGVPLPPLPSK